MKISNLISLAVLLLFVDNSAVEAKTNRWKVSAKSGEKITLGIYKAWHDKTCFFKNAKIDVVTKPIFGQVTASPVQSKITSDTQGVYFGCKGKVIKGLRVIYKSNRHFRGVDTLKIRHKVKGESENFYIYTINVD